MIIGIKLPKNIRNSSKNILEASMRKLASLFLLLCAALLAQADLTILAVVGDEVITSQDLQQYISNAIRGQTPAKIAEIRKEALESFINKELIYLEFKRLKGQVPQDYLQKRINAEIDRFANGDQQLFEQQLFQQGLTMKEYRERMTKNLAVELLTHEKVAKGILISDKEIQDYYYSHREDFRVQKQTRIAVIQLKENGKYAGKISETVEEILGKLADGEDFGELAKAYSEGANASAGGDLGWQTALAPSLEEMAEGMKAGEINPKPIHIGQSEVLVKLIERNPGGILPLDSEQKELIRKILSAEETNRRYEAFIRELYVRFPVMRMAEE